MNEVIEPLTAGVQEAGRRMQQWLLDVTPDLEQESKGF